MTLLLYTLSILITSYYIFGKHKSAVFTLGWKALSSLCFVSIGISWMLDVPGSYGIWMAVGLVLGMAGDVFLNLPPCDPDRKDLWFLAGLGSFLMGHLAYVYALYHTDMLITLILLLTGVIISFVLLSVLQKQKLIDLDKMFVPAFLYAVVILFFEFQCLSWLVEELNTFTFLLNIGSILFVISDMILLFILFGSRDTKTMSCLNLTTYYLAQICLATSILLFQA